jgi:hypothetical protein
MPRLCRLEERVSSTLHLPHPSWLRQVGHRTSLRTQFETSKPKENSIYVVFIVLTNKIGGYLCRWFRFAQLAKGKKSRPLYHRERILETSTLSCNEEEEEITKPPKR